MVWRYLKTACSLCPRARSCVFGAVVIETEETARMGRVAADLDYVVVTS